MLLASQSDGRILKLTTSLEQNDEIAWFFCMLIIIYENKIWLKNSGVNVVKKKKMGAATQVTEL